MTSTRQRPLATPSMHLLLVLVLGALSLAPCDTGFAQTGTAPAVSSDPATTFSRPSRSLDPANPVVDVDPWQAFEQAAELASREQLADAAARLRIPAQSGNPALVASAHYNLGCLATQQLQAGLDASPERAAGPARERTLQLADEALGHFRDCLHVDPEHIAARQNLELLRAWIHDIQETWRRHDRARRIQAMRALELLDWLQTRQRELRRRTWPLAAEPDSQSRRRAIRELAAEQRDLADEPPLLAEKITGEIAEQWTRADAAAMQPPEMSPAPQPTAPQPTAPPFASEASRLAAEVQAEMKRAASALDERDPVAARDAQTDSVVALNRLFETTAPFDWILQRAIETQRELVAESQRVETSTVDAAEQTSDAARVFELSESQLFIARWAATLRALATEELREAARQPTASEPRGQRAENLETTETEVEPSDPLASRKKAVELTPRIEALSDQAAADLSQQRWSAALPRQQEALQLLEEINQQLKDEQQQQNDQQSQSAPADAAQDGRQQPSSTPGEAPPSPEEPEQQDGSSEPSGDDQQPQSEPKPEEPRDAKDDESRPEPETPEAPEDAQTSAPRDATEEPVGSDEFQPVPQSPWDEPERRQAEALLRRVRQREREYRERQLELQRLLKSRVRVEKDW